MSRFNLYWMCCRCFVGTFWWAVCCHRRLFCQQKGVSTALTWSWVVGVFFCFWGKHKIFVVCRNVLLRSKRQLRLVLIVNWFTNKRVEWEEACCLIKVTEIVFFFRFACFWKLRPINDLLWSKRFLFCWNLDGDESLRSFRTTVAP